MELWIRSQDKTILSKAQNIIIRENRDENNETNYAIVDIYTMGIYKTKERALEVLDDIQARIKPYTYKMTSNLNLKNGYDKLDIPYQFNVHIYEMPKE